jgi:hypothetical protein
MTTHHPTAGTEATTAVSGILNLLQKKGQQATLVYTVTYYHKPLENK